ncbi:MAG: pyridoxal phosphate-dependent aminotransferase [Bacillota bacterium]
MLNQILLEENIDRIAMPENLATGLMVAKQRQKCAAFKCDFNYYSFAFGQSPFPVPATLAQALERAAEKSAYADAEGILELRKAAASFNARHFGLDPDPERIMVGPGTKGLFFLLFSILSGEIIIPVPSWIGYAPQATFLNKNYHPLLTNSKNSYKLTADDLEQFIKTQGKKQYLLVLNHPNNPTGAVYSKDELTAITEVCRNNGVIVLSDEIYALTTFDISSFTSMGTVYPEGTFVLNGLSKDRSAGGYRLGICHLPDADCRKIRHGLQKLAATAYTNITTPVQYAAIEAYKENEDIEAYYNVTRELHRIMGTTISKYFTAIEGLRVTKPQGGFYFYVDFNDLKQDLQENGIENSNQLGEALIAHPHHLATITGNSLLLPPDNYGARIAYVDYNGNKAYQAFLDRKPTGSEEETAFVEEFAPMMVKGTEVLTDFVASLKERKLTIN